jgi:hypothetical protein
MRPSRALALSLILLAVFAAALFMAQGFRAQARLFPTVIAVAGLAFALTQLGQEVRRAVTRPSDAQQQEAAAPTAEGDPEELPEPIAPEVRQRRALAILGWILAFILFIWLIGFMTAVPIFVFAYLRFGARESWPVSLAYGIGSGAIFYVLFGKIVRIPFEEGFVFSLLAGY